MRRAGPYLAGPEELTLPKRLSLRKDSVTYTQCTAQQGFPYDINVGKKSVTQELATASGVRSSQ